MGDGQVRVEGERFAECLVSTLEKFGEDAEENLR
jgi:hypothetical protein